VGRCADSKDDDTGGHGSFATYAVSTGNKLLYSPLYFYLLFATSRFFLPSEALVSKSNSFYGGKKKASGVFWLSVISCVLVKLDCFQKLSFD
jgi:hypothetical protein